MRKSLAAAMAAVTFGGAIAATAAPAYADAYNDYRYRRHGNGDSTAAAIVAGVAGLAIGAALASKNDRYGNSRYGASRYYDRGYGYGDSYQYGYGANDSYGSGYGYGYDPRTDGYYGGYNRSYGQGYDDDRGRSCVSRERVWDPYLARSVKIERRYPC